MSLQPAFRGSGGGCDKVRSALCKYNDLTGGFNSTVEPPNNGQLGTRHFVHCSEVGLSWRSTNIFN